MVPCSVGHEKFSLAFPFKKSTCPRQALIELIAPPQFTLALHVLEIANFVSSLLTVNNFHADNMFTWGCVRVMSKQTSLESANWLAGHRSDHVENPWLVDRCISTNNIITTTTPNIFTEQFGYDRKEKWQASTSLPEPQSDASKSTNVNY